jgi:hypothetical protein
MYQILSQALSGPWHYPSRLKHVGEKCWDTQTRNTSVRSVGTHKQGSGLQYACIPIRAYP